MKWLETQREYQYGPEPYNMFGRRPLGNILEEMKKTPYVKLFINNPLVVVPIIIAVGIYIKQKKVSEILGVTGWKIALVIPILWATFKFGKQIAAYQRSGSNSGFYNWPVFIYGKQKSPNL